MRKRILKRLAEKRQHLKKKGKGFTLVELIVVIIVIAILVATAIPALTYFENNARKRRIQSEHRELVIAIQASISELSDSMDVAQRKSITMQTVESYFSKNGKDKLREVLEKNGENPAHTIEDGVLTSRYHPTGAADDKDDEVWIYDFNVHQ